MDPNDQREKEGLDLSDWEFSSVMRPDGLLHGLGANSYGCAGVQPVVLAVVERGGVIGARPLFGAPRCAQRSSVSVCCPAP